MSAKPKKQRVECDRCVKKVWLNADGTYPEHTHITYPCDRYGRRIIKAKNIRQCENSGKRYAFHMGEFFVTKRDSNGWGVEWKAQCRCGESWTGPEHDDVEAPWAQHAQEMKAQVAA